MSLDLGGPAPARVTDRPDPPFPPDQVAGGAAGLTVVRDQAPAVGHDVSHHVVVDRPLHAGEAGPAPERSAPPIAPQAAEDVVEAVRRSLAVESSAVRTWSRWDLSVPVQDFVQAVGRHRVIGIVASHGASTGLDPAACALLRPAVRAWATEGMALTADTVRLHRLLTAARLPHLVHRGAALAAQTTGRGEARGGGDVDLLLDAADAPAAHRVLLDAGWHPRPDGTPVPGDGSAWHWASFVDRERAYDGPGRPVDLHWRISSGGGLFGPTPALLDRAVRVGAGGDPVPTLSPPDALLAACWTALLDDLSSARHLLDVARLLQLAGPDDLDGAPAAARRLVRDVTGFVTALLGAAGTRPAGRRPGPPSGGSGVTGARWADGRVRGTDARRRVTPGARRARPLGARLADLGRDLVLEPGPASWARLAGYAVLPPRLLAGGPDSAALPVRTVLRHGGRRMLKGCLPRH